MSAEIDTHQQFNQQYLSKQFNYRAKFDFPQLNIFLLRNTNEIRNGFKQSHRNRRTHRFGCAIN